MWNAGVDGIYVFNFSHKPPSPEFNLLHEMGDPETLAHLTKMYVPDPRSNRKAVGWWLKGGEEYVTRATLQAMPHDLADGQATVIDLLIGDDLAAAAAQGLTPTVKLRLYVSGMTGKDVLVVKLNDRDIGRGGLDPERNLVRFQLKPEQVIMGFNRFELQLAASKTTRTALEDLQLWVSYK